MLDDLSKTLMNVVYAGVGAVSLVAEQAGKAGKVLVERGEAAVEQMGKYSEELQRKCQEDAQRRRDELHGRTLSAMSAQEREELRRRLDQLDELDRRPPNAQRRMPAAPRSRRSMAVLRSVRTTTENKPV